MAQCDQCGAPFNLKTWNIKHRPDCPYIRQSNPKTRTIKKHIGRAALIIPGELMTLNEYIDLERTNRFMAAKAKETETQKVCKILNGFDGILQSSPYDVTIFWYRKNRRSDPDNIAFAVKFIFDGMQQAGILRNDGWSEINSICHIFHVDKNNPRIELFFEPLGE